jgi:hypothetical protein
VECIRCGSERTRKDGQTRYRAIDEDGQIAEASFSERRNANAAEAFFRRAISETNLTPMRATTGYPPGEGKMLSSSTACCAA